jgi:Ni,Fe-hydrogenase III large subunit
MNFFTIDGDEIHEVAVGPVHAGVIEPGHFRFQCHGEQVFHLEISLGYQHRGVERALVGGPNKRTIHYLETLAGDTTVGHATAYCQAIEGLAGCKVPARAQVLRGVALELERVANHTGDLGALAGDVGYLPTMSFCGRLRGDFLNMTALLCGSRFGRGLVRPGGVGFDLDDARAGQLVERLEQALRDVTGAAELLWNTSSVRARFENAGTVSREMCYALGLVGPVARGCGVRNFQIHPSAGFHLPHGRRIRAGVCALAGNPTLGGVHLRPTQSAAARPDSRRAQTCGGPRDARVTGGGLARRDLSRRNDGREGSVLALQSG